ncbi:FecCD family ABC transporter permease [Desulfolucanica intricata]|uniref:FecCD family ABC transporter permease n=1 Tax=Desulfolucanica intricata TaxID=1285191 RepID=UPI0008347084|nr:iron chelate uptake ABC transporter family permease subunit [Desulfolucanica intricata]
MICLLGKYKTKTVIVSLLVLLGFVIIFAATVGPAHISISEAFRIIMSEIPVIKNFVPAEELLISHRVIVLQVRLPRIFLGLFVGAALAAVGAALQGLFKNPMADPYVIGVSSGAALGATVAIVSKLDAYFLGMGAVPMMAFGGALITTFIVYNLARIGRKVPVSTLLLAGIATGSFFQAIISFMMVLNSQKLEQIVFWLMGSLSAKSWDHVIMSGPYVMIGILVIYCFARDLNILVVGEESARNLGVEVERVKKILLAAAALVTAAAVSVSGIIGFVGLIVPHMVRMIVGPDHRILIPVSALFGSTFMIITDTVARTVIAPTEIPVGIITALFGGPFFIYLLRKRKSSMF